MLEAFCTGLRQKVNKIKTKVFFSNNVESSVKRRLSSRLGVAVVDDLRGNSESLCFIQG